MIQKKVLGEIYSYLTKYMIKYCEFGCDNIITRDNIIFYLGKILHISNKHVRYKVVAELENYGYIVQVTKQGSRSGIKYKILG